LKEVWDELSRRDTYRSKRKVKRRAAEKRKEEKEKKKFLTKTALCVGSDEDIDTNAEIGKIYSAKTWN